MGAPGVEHAFPVGLEAASWHVGPAAVKQQVAVYLPENFTKMVPKHPTKASIHVQSA